MSAPVFVVRTDLLQAGPVVVDGAEGHHAATVVRLALGEPVDLVDGEGRRGHGTVSAVRRRDVVEVDIASVVDEPVSSPRFVVVQALPKGDRGEAAVEMMTEVGVDEVIPWAAARCVTKWRDARGEKAVARWRSSAVAAGKQSRRARFPVVSDLADTGEVIGRCQLAAAAVVLHEQAAAPLSSLTLPMTGEVILVVGPEGGIGDDELAAFESASASKYRLGPTVLRTSTAGTVALAVLLSRRWR